MKHRKPQVQVWARCAFDTLKPFKIRILIEGGHPLYSYCGGEHASETHWDIPCWFTSDMVTLDQQRSGMEKYDQNPDFVTVFLGEL